MANISWNEIQDRAVEFAGDWSNNPNLINSERGATQRFWSDFLNVFGVDQRRHGAFFEYAVKKLSGNQGFIDLFWPGKLLAEQKAPGRDLEKAITQAFEYTDTMPDHDLPQAIVVCDFNQIVLINQHTRERTAFALQDLPKHVKLFGFLINEQSQNLAEEDPVNIKAAEAMARLHNQLRDDNYSGHDLELLLVRLMFCMFADDSGIFEHGQLRSYLKNRTNTDGSDFGARLMDIFQTINTPVGHRQHSLDTDLMALEYVNGGLFSETIRTPHFTSTMRTDLLSAMELDWSKVSPAIFGSMFQGVMDEKERRNLGAHYTSEKNILRVIKPLFLDDLYAEFAHIVRSTSKKADKLREFQNKLASLTFLDPACGSGNFLVITYRELRRLEHKVVDQINKTNKRAASGGTVDWLAASQDYGQLKVNVSQMHGIEIEEFPSLIAWAALWLTDQQMNMEFSHTSGKMFKRLPLTSSAKIVNANALTTDWKTVIHASELNYILGNPPFVGSKMMTATMRSELLAQFAGVQGAGVLDYVTAWYAKATSLMDQNHRIQAALVSTNSIIQGEQVPVLWKYLFSRGVHINFLHQTFKWSNDARGNAAVYCTIVGFAKFNKTEKRIFEYTDIKGEPNEVIAQNINGYGINAPSIFIERRGKPLCNVPPMSFGNMPLDGGNLILTEQEKVQFLFENPDAKHFGFVKELVGAKEFLQNKKRYCLWLVNSEPHDIHRFAFILDRIEKTRHFRLNSSAPSTVEHAIRAKEFRDTNNPREYVLIPRVSSENRKYIPMGFFGVNEIASDSCQIIPNATLYHFGILTSQMHMAWMRAVAGRLESRYRYSKDIVYNNFIWPTVTADQKKEVERLAQSILDARAQFPNSSLADLYDPLTMPPALSKAHKALDKYVDKLYQKSGFNNDAARVAHLFELYKKATHE